MFLYLSVVYNNHHNLFIKKGTNIFNYSAFFCLERFLMCEIMYFLNVFFSVFNLEKSLICLIVLLLIKGFQWCGLAFQMLYRCCTVSGKISRLPH